MTCRRPPPILCTGLPSPFPPAVFPQRTHCRPPIFSIASACRWPLADRFRPPTTLHAFNARPWTCRFPPVLFLFGGTKFPRRCRPPTMDPSKCSANRGTLSPSRKVQTQTQFRPAAASPPWSPRTHLYIARLGGAALLGARRTPCLSLARPVPQHLLLLLRPAALDVLRDHRHASKLDEELLLPGGGEYCSPPHWSSIHITTCGDCNASCFLPATSIQPGQPSLAIRLPS